MLFLTNLQKATYEHYKQADEPAQGWLLSSHRSSASAMQRARRLAALGAPLMADNGTIEHIRRTDAQFDARASALLSSFKQYRRTLPRRDRDIAIAAMPERFRTPASALAVDIGRQVDLAFDGIDDSDQLEVQLSMAPTHLICKEDWSIAVGLGLGLERNLTGWSTERYVTRNRRSLRAWAEIADRVDAGAHFFVTLAAPDYPTARAVAREAADWGAANVALGFAGLNSTGGYTYVSRHPHRRRLVRPGPQRYVRLAEIACGLRDGYRERGVTLQRFHALGLGARAMWPILVAGFDWWTELSIDATSAKMDVEGKRPVLYDPDDLGHRVAVVDIATHYATTGELPLRSPLLAAALVGHDRSTAAAWLEHHERIRHDDLHSSSPLAAALPLFANGPGTSDAAWVLTHHNYWASEVAAAMVPERQRRQWALDTLDDLAVRPGRSVTIRNGAAVALDVVTEGERTPLPAA